MQTRYLSTTTVLLTLMLCQAARAATPSPEEMAELRQWVAARVETPPGAAATKAAVAVLANHGPVQANARGEKPLRFGDREFKRGFYCHAPSKMVVRLPAPGKTFTATVGIDSNDQTRPGGGSVVFSVTVADKEAWRSEVLREGMPGVAVQVDLGGAKEFTLAVSDSGDGISCDQSDWADAQVTLADGKTIWLGDLPLVERAEQDANAAPFSFTYDGRASEVLLPGWKREYATRQLDDHRTEHVVTCTDPKTGLVVRCVAVEYRDFPVVEWTLYFKNTGAANSPILEAIQAVDVALYRGPQGEFVLHHMRGDLCTPDSFEPLSTTLAPGATQRFAPSGGRPTQGQWPYYNVQWADRGRIVAIGWPGQWAAEFRRDEADGLRIRGGQELTHLSLRPGEEVRSPLVVVQFYRGDRIRAQNVWRAWMLAHNVPRPGGKPPEPMFSSCSGGFFPGLKCNEADERRFIDTFIREGIKLDYWWMDAGWYPCDGWPTVGTWEVDRERFPHGIRAVSDHAHGQGAKLILWFEPERVAAGTWLPKEHPDWVLGGAGGGLLNLGNPDARRWLTDHVDGLIKSEGIGLYRQDFNIDPLGFWRAHDTADRQGITEIRHVEGYLAYWDELRRRHPDMLIDSCASGGRRNDLETMRRAVPLLRSDYQSFGGDPAYAAGNQGHTYGLALWLPFFGTGAYYNTNQMHYAGRSYFCPAFAYCADVRTEGIDWQQIRRLVGNWRAIADCWRGDYYPLTEYTLSEGAWMAWQFDRPDLGKGMVQVFRRPESIYESARPRLRGLDPAARYEIVNLDLPGTSALTGKELIDAGLPVSMPERPSAAIFTYRRIEP